MIRRFRICIPKGGRGSLRPNYGWRKLTLISKKNLQHWGVTKNCLSHNFWNTHLNHFFPYSMGRSDLRWASSISKIVEKRRVKSGRFPFFTDFLVRLQKKSFGLVYAQFWRHRPSILVFFDNVEFPDQTVNLCLLYIFRKLTVHLRCNKTLFF